jgi:transcriptional regulator with XRE-family HTH domain
MVSRAALILALADGLSYREIGRRFGASAPTISLWKQRFVKERLAGLQGRHKASQPPASTPELQARVNDAYQKLPNRGTHWSGRKLARHMGLDKSTVQRILSGADRRTGGMDQLMAAFDPQFGEKAVEIIALYLDPPQYAAVFVVREETADRSIPAAWRGFQDHRSPLRDLYSSLVGCQGAKQYPSVQFTDFLESLVQKTRWAPEIHVLHHNLEQETDALGRLLGFRPEVWSYSLSRCTTWMKLVEFWLCKVGA